MSSLPMSDLPNAPWVNYPRVALPRNDQVQNYCLCALCREPFLLDVSGSSYCGRELCQAVRMCQQRYAESLDAQRSVPVA